jgi:glycosidase
MLATVMLTGREAPMIFYGQEIGMASNAATPAPMQWGAEPGFTSGTSSIALGPNAAAATVAAEDADPVSLLNWYRKLSALRQQGFALKGGTVTLVDTGYPDVVAWVRKGSTTGERPVLVMCNLSGRGVLISVEQQLKQIGLKPTSGMVPLALSFTGVNPSYTATGIDLPAYGIYLGEILQPGLEDSPAPMVSRRRGR